MSDNMRVSMPLRELHRMQDELELLEEQLEERGAAVEVAKELRHQLAAAQQLPGQMHMAWIKVLRWLGVKGRGHTAVREELHAMVVTTPNVQLHTEDEITEALRLLCRTYRSEGQEVKPSPVQQPPALRTLQGAWLVSEERARQITEEGRTPAHDRQYSAGVLARAAAAYLQGYRDRLLTGEEPERPAVWPWDGEYWKPKDALRDLVRAGALVAAEIDRLLDTEQEQPGGGSGPH